MLKKVSYKDQVYEYLKEAIIKGELKPGEIYSEQQFADMLNISRTPVREAVLQLKSEDLVEIYNNRGLGVKAISLEDIQQILQARSAIEGYSVRYLAKRVETPEGKEALEALRICLEQAEGLVQDEADHYEYMKADIEFHGIIVRFTQNIYFIRMIDQMRTRMEQATVNSLTLKNRHIDALQEHKVIFSHLCKGDVEKAVEALQEHMRITERILHAAGLA